MRGFICRPLVRARGLNVLEAWECVRSTGTAESSARGPAPDVQRRPFSAVHGFVVRHACVHAPLNASDMGCIAACATRQRLRLSASSRHTGGARGGGGGRRCAPGCSGPMMACAPASPSTFLWPFDPPPLSLRAPTRARRLYLQMYLVILPRRHWPVLCRAAPVVVTCRL